MFASVCISMCECVRMCVIGMHVLCKFLICTIPLAMCLIWMIKSLIFAAGGLMKIIEERPNMITVPVHDYKSEDELKFIASLSTLDQQQKVTPNLNTEHTHTYIHKRECESKLLCTYSYLWHQLPLWANMSAKYATLCVKIIWHWPRIRSITN